MAGFAKVIQVTVNLDGSITVADDGAAFPSRPIQASAAPPWKA